MSGHLGHIPDSAFQDYGQHRYMMDVRQKINHSLLGRTINNTLQQNGRLPTHQFYGQGHASSVNQTQPSTSNPPSDVMSDGFPFIAPQPTKEYEMMSKYRTKWSTLIHHLSLWGKDTQDQKTMRFVYKMYKETFHSAVTSPVETDQLLQLDSIYNSVKKHLYDNQVPRSVCGTSSVSDRSYLDRGINSTVGMQLLDRPSSHTTSVASSQMSFYGNNTNRMHLLDKPSSQSSSQISFFNTNPGWARPDPVEVRRGRGQPPSKQRQQEATKEEMDAAMKALETPDNVDLFDKPQTAPANDGPFSTSEITQTRLLQGSTKPNKGQTKISKQSKKGTPDYTVNTKLNNTANQRGKDGTPIESNPGKGNHNNNSNSSSGGKTTRTGRVIKTPNAYWKNNELNDTRTNQNVKKETSPNVDFNESMTLRNNKIIAKGKTPPLSVIVEDDNTRSSNIDQQTKKNPVARKRKGKENVDLPEKKTSKKTNTSKETIPTLSTIQEKKQKTALPKTKESKVNKSQTQNPKQAKVINSKKDTNKRNSKESDGNIPKRKKIERVLPEFIYGDDDDDDDELFGRVNYRKVQHTTQALSPSNGMSSAKKAVGSLLSKETPPCKTFVHVNMNISSHSAASTSKEAPICKTTQVAKRVKKAMEHDKTKPVKPVVKHDKVSNESKHSKSTLLNSVLSKQTSVTPLSKNMFIGSEPQSDSDNYETDIEDMEDQEDLS